MVYIWQANDCGGGQECHNFAVVTTGSEAGLWAAKDVTTARNTGWNFTGGSVRLIDDDCGSSSRRTGSYCSQAASIAPQVSNKAAPQRQKLDGADWYSNLPTFLLLATKYES